MTAAAVKPTAAALAGNTQPLACGQQLELSRFEPKSMLQLPETHIARARFPVIDFHTHITRAASTKNGVPLVAARRYLATPGELLEVMDGKNIRAMVNLTGGYGDGLQETVTKFDRAHPDRFYTFTEPS